MIKILSIDDSKAVHAYLKDCFAHSNIEVTHAYSGEDGLGILGKNAPLFDLILLDWEMPGLTGPQVLDRMNSLGIKAPVIMLTSKGEIENISEMLTKGAQEYIIKPFTEDIIFSKIESVIGLKVEKNGTH